MKYDQPAPVATLISGRLPDGWRTADVQGTYDRLNEMLNRELSAVLSPLYPLPVLPGMCLFQPAIDWHQEGTRSSDVHASSNACKHLLGASLEELVGG